MIKNRGKKLLTAVLSTVLAVSMMPAISSPMTVYAEGDKTVVGLGSDGIKDPDPGEVDKLWTGSYVWFGAYDNSPIKFRVLDSKTSRFGGVTMFLDSDKMLFRSQFNEASSGFVKKWEISNMKAYLNKSAFLDKPNGFSEIEKSAIAPSTIKSHTIYVGEPMNTMREYPYYTPLDGDKVFLLDFEDILNTSYGYSSFCGLDKEGGSYHGVKNHLKATPGYPIEGWWLRSQNHIENGYFCGVSATSGNLGGFQASESLGVCPALNVDLESVVFSSVIIGTAGKNYAEYKLTLKDSDMNVDIPSNKNVTASESKVTVPYIVSGANSDNATQVSILILDKEYTPGNINEANIKYYGKLNTSETFLKDSEGTFEFPSGLNITKWGEDYHVYLLAEDVNGEKETDYASEPVKLDKPEGVVSTEYTVTLKNDGNGTASTSVVKGIEGTEVILTATPKSGYQLKEWQVISGGVTVYNNKIVIGKSDVEIKAVFELIPISSCTVSFDANGGSGTMNKDIINKNSDYTLPKCTFTAPEGKEFDKWDAGNAGESIKITSDITIKPVWKDKPVEQTPTPKQTSTSDTNPTPSGTSARDEADISPENPVKISDVEKTIINIKDEKDAKGSTFTLLKAKGSPKSKKSIKLSWSKVSGAEKYMIYGNKCGRKNKYKYITTVTGTSYIARKLKKGTYYKYTIVAVKGDEAIATSKTIHVVTDGGKKGNNTKVKLSKTKLSLNAGKSKKIKAILKYNKKVAAHRKVAWESDNVSVATVKNGKITAVGKGTCYVYAYAQNGVSTKIKVTVN